LIGQKVLSLSQTISSMNQEEIYEPTHSNVENNIDPETQMTEHLTADIHTKIKKRISQIFPKWIDQENKQSVARDLLATERTWLAWVRTGNLSKKSLICSDGFCWNGDCISEIY
jgi:ATP adenylyltransferase/5',5'''-P-1,P-4-tetraphosphate phosphorylase II